MKKSLFCALGALILAFAICFTLVSCGGGAAETVSVSYDLGGGKLPEGAPKSYEVGKEPDFSKIVPTLENCEFGGWYLDSEFTKPASAADAKDGRLKLYAKWLTDSFSIEYVLDGGVGNDLPASYSFGDWINLTSLIPTKDGCIFTGWFYDSSFAEQAFAIEEDTSGDITLYAKWAPAINKLADISDVTKGYFGDGFSTVKIDVADYLSSTEGMNVSYSVSSSSPLVVEATAEGSVLTLDFCRAVGSSEISVDVFVDGVICAEFNFTAAPKNYSKIACIGDSLTSYDPDNPTYPMRLENLLADFGTEVGVFGKSGASISNFTNSDSYGKYIEYAEELYHESMAFDPDLIIIMFGTNDATRLDENGDPKFSWEDEDIAADMKREYIALINEYRAQYPNADIVILTSPEVLDSNSLNNSNEIMEIYTYPTQLEIANEAGVKLVDLREYLKGLDNKEDLYRDGVHFTLEGSDIIAEFILGSV